MLRTVQLAMGLALLLAPFALASDPFAPRVCDAALGCVGPGPCVADVYCQATLCDPALECKGSFDADLTCGTNATYAGETCQRRVTVGGAAGRSATVPVVGETRPAPVGAGVVLTDGNVTGRNLPNAWLSHAAYVSLPGAGETSVTVYRSVIGVDGSPDDVDLFLFPQEDHTFTEVGLAVRHGSPGAGRADLVVGLVLLDLAPEGCFVRSSTGFGPDYSCPRLRVVS